MNKFHTFHKCSHYYGIYENETYVLKGAMRVKGITKVVDELGLMILSKEIELEMKQNEIDKLKKKIELIEGYLEMYDEFYNKSDK